MPEQHVDMVISVLAAAEELEATVKTMLVEGLPHAVMEGCSHPYQKEFMGLTGGVLEGSKQHTAAELAAVETDLQVGEGELERIKTAELDAKGAFDEAATSSGVAEAAATKAAESAKEAQVVFEGLERSSQRFLQHLEQQRQEHLRADAVVEGPLRLLMCGGWEDEETKIEAITAVLDLLGEIRVDKVLIAAAPHALGLKPDSRRRFDIMAVDTVTKVLVDHLSGLDSKVQAGVPEERFKKAEIVGLWAIADCARDRCTAAAEALACAQDRQALAEADLETAREQVAKQGEEIAERTAKRARIGARLGQVDEALLAVSKLSAGERVVEQQAVGTDAPSEAVVV